MHTLRILLLLPLLAGYLTSYGQGRTTTEEYIERYKAIAVEHMEKFGIPASITMAQGILESSSGNSTLSIQSNNHFGIKCKKSWKGDRVYHDDDAKGECFRAYPTVEDSYLDHARFLDTSPRYDSLFRYPSNDYRSWARGLKAAGYATAPDYTERLIRIIEKYRLYMLDAGNAGAYHAYDPVSEATSPSVPVSMTDHVAHPSHAARHSAGVNPDAYQISAVQYMGHSVYQTNHVFHVTVSEGDTYASIASTFHISERNLRKFNDADRTSEPREGEAVYLGLKQKSWEGDEVTHRVLAGETLRSIAQAYAIRLKFLARMNRMRADAKVEEGSEIRIRK